MLPLVNRIAAVSSVDAGVTSGADPAAVPACNFPRDAGIRASGCSEGTTVRGADPHAMFHRAAPQPKIRWAVIALGMPMNASGAD